jgi:hypothetical protein
MTLEQWRAKRQRREFALSLVLYAAVAVLVVWVALVASPALQRFAIERACTGSASPLSISFWACVGAWRASA